MTTKRITLAIAILSTVATIMAALGDYLPPQWALVVAALGAGAYAVVRALQKVAAGASLKSLFSTTEAWGAGLVVLAAIVSAVAGVVPVGWAGGAVAFAAILIKVARVLQAAQASGAMPADPAAPEKGADKTPVTVPLHPKDRGSAQVRALFVAALLGLLAALVAPLLCPRAARAEGPQFGGCSAAGRVCAGPAVALTLGEFNLSTQRFSGGLSPGIGYGATLNPSQWYATGLAAYLAFSVGGGEPNRAMPSLLLSFANYVRLGAGLSIEETTGPVRTQWRLLFGLGTDFGGSPRYVAGVAGR